MGILTSQFFYVQSFNSYNGVIQINTDGSERVRVVMNALQVLVYDYITVRRRNTTTEFQVDMFRTQNRSFMLRPSNTLELNYCVTNLTGLFGCSRLIDKVKYANGQTVNPNRITVQPTGTLCYTPNFMQGAVLIDQTYDRNYLNLSNIVQGMKCVISVTDVPTTEDRMRRCCTMQNITEYQTGNIIPSIVPNFVTFTELINWSDVDYMRYDCPYVFLNAYQTSHCDEYMKTYCGTNPTNPECQIWLLKSTKASRIVASSVYNTYCKTNLNNPVCMMFSLISNLYGVESYSDDSLRTYCNNNPNDPNCQCYVMSNNPNMLSISTYIGPLECWFKSCAEQANQQFLLSNQIRQRKNCKISVCDVNIGSINSPEAIVNIVNTCSGTVENSIVYNSSVSAKRDKMPLLIPFSTSVLLAGLIWLVGRI
jgi:hypothetical protein